MRFIYGIGIRLYGILIRIASLFNPKAKKWIDGRKDWDNQISNFKSSKNNLYWFHCASLGEFEQGRPIIEALKEKGDCQIAVSFFTPSGYEVRKNYDKADLVFYLPLDTKRNARQLVSILKPTKVFIVKYEFWANLIFELQHNAIPIYLVSGLFRSKQSFFNWYGGFFRKVLKQFTTIFVQDQASENLLKSINVQSIISGDTRYDRVMSNSAKAKKIDLVEQFCVGEKVLVVGSSWLEDEQVLMPSINSADFTQKVIIAPHEINESRLKQIESQLTKKSVRYSKFEPAQTADVLIIDNIGMLMHIYQYGNIAYVGGGFRTGLHNILEPASFGLPVMFGPNHQKFPEAKMFIDEGIGFEVDSAEKLKTVYDDLLNGDYTKAVINFMEVQKGASDIVLDNIS